MQAQTETQQSNRDVLMLKNFIELNVLALDFHTACIICLFFLGSACVFEHVGKVIQVLCHECGFYSR